MTGQTDVNVNNVSLFFCHSSNRLTDSVTIYTILSVPRMAFGSTNVVQALMTKSKIQYYFAERVALLIILYEKIKHSCPRRIACKL
jgi:hypothetical protein